MISWGFLGAGWIAKTALAPAVHAAHNATLQAVASRDHNRATALGPHTVYDSYEDLLADPTIDAVYINLANDQHCQWSIAAMAAGKLRAIVATASLDPIRDSGRAYARALVDAGRDVVFLEMRGVTHSFVNLRQMVPSTQKDLERIIAAMRFMLGNPA